MRTLMLSLFLVWVVESGAGAEPKAPNGLLTAEEIAAEFPGTRMEGKSSRGEEFSECIEPGGKSVFKHPRGVSTGMMKVEESGNACFTYQSGTWCYRVQRAPSGYIIRSIDNDMVYFVRSVEREVKTCDASDLIS